MSAAELSRPGRPGRPGRFRRSRGGEQPVVPPAEFRSYYGRPVIKQPAWKSPDVPVYLFLGGLAGASATMAGLAELTGRAQLARVGQLVAALAATSGTGVLVHDLGRPARFLNMLRTAKITSPLNTGSWVLASFSTFAGAGAASAVTGWLPRPGQWARAGAAILGPLMTSYTAVLLADTAVPAWHEAHRELPFLFAGGALASGAGVAMIAAPPEQSGPARLRAATGTAIELVAERRLTSRLGLIAEPYQTGRAARFMRVGRLLAAAGAVAALAGRRNRVVAAVGGLALVAGSLCTRFGVFEAGRESARDPKYTVVPQRQRLAARRHSSAT